MRSKCSQKSLVLCEADLIRRSDYHHFTIASYLVPYDELVRFGGRVELGGLTETEEKVGQRDKLSKEIYNDALLGLGEFLNVHRGCNFDALSWHIILGPWLKHWIDVNLLRWIRLEECITSDVREVHTLDVEYVMEITAPPETRLDFAKQVADPLWSQCQLSLFTQYLVAPSCHVVYHRPKERPAKSKLERPGGKERRFRRFFRLAVTLLERSSYLVSSVVPSNYRIVIETPYLSLYEKLKLALLTRKVPVFYFRRCPALPIEELDLTLRSKVLKPFVCSHPFGKFVQDTLLQQLPICFLENFDQILDAARALPLPNSASAVYSGSGPIDDLAFLLKIASCKDLRDSWIISQHGAVYGELLATAKGEFYETGASMAFLSWGWSRHSQPNVIPSVATLKTVDWECSGPTAFRILLALPTLEVSSNRLVFVEVLDQLDFIEAFLSSIDPLPFQNVVTRAKGPDDIRNELFPFFARTTRDKELTLSTSLLKSQLFVGFFGTTTCLEAMSANMPCLLLIDGQARFLNSETRVLLEPLIRLEVCFLSRPKLQLN